MNELIEGVLRYFTALTADPDADKPLMRVGNPLAEWPSALDWVPGDVKDVYLRCNGLYAYVYNTRTERLHFLAFDGMKAPDTWKTMKEGAGMGLSKS